MIDLEATQECPVMSELIPWTYVYDCDRIMGAWIASADAASGKAGGE